VPVSMPALGCDYFGASLHKWVGAPHGTGLLFVRKPAIADVWPLFATDDPRSADIRKFENIGTRPAAAFNGVVDALAIDQPSLSLRMERLAALSRMTAARLQRLDGVALVGRPVGAILAIQVKGVPPDRLARRLREQANVLIGDASHPDIRGLRVSPGLTVRDRDIETFVDAFAAAIHAERSDAQK